MKKLLSSTSLFIIACVLFSSCSKDVGISVIKRQHRNGYYVSFKNNKQNKNTAKPVSKNEEVVTHIAQAESNSSIENNKKEEGANVKTQIAIALSQKENTVIGSNPIIKTQSKNDNSNTAAAVETKTDNSNKNLLKKQVAAEKKLQKLSPKKNGRGGILWTIIVIILLLWLAGFLLGNVGGIIHLLLVIVLILLILRLLGLI